MTKKYVQQISLEEMQEYGEFFRLMRKSAGYNLEQFAKLIGTHRTTLDRWEKAKIIPSRDIYEIERKVREVVKDAVKAARAS